MLGGSRGSLAVAVTAMLMVYGWAAAGARAAVSERGSATTSLQVAVPAFHGIEPAMSLRYDPASGDGLVGVGWHLEAASYITRVGRRGGAPRFDDHDEFLVDGEELVACAPDCPSGGTHETRKRDFVRTSFDGKMWTRWRPDGVRLEYAPVFMIQEVTTFRRHARPARRA